MKPKSMLTVCRDVLRVEDAEIEQLQEMAQNQLDYLSPLKMATSAHQHALGKHNLAVIEKFKELRAVIQSGAAIRTNSTMSKAK